MSSTKHKIGLVGALVATVAFAITYGPFPVSALGPDYAQTTYRADAESEYEAANKISQIYLAPILTTPSKIAKAIRNDYLRVAYFDGQIADFKIKRWPSSNSLEFTKKVPNANEKPRVVYVPDTRGCSKYTKVINTGYWGVSYPDTGDSGLVITNAAWVSTGPVIIAGDSCK